MQYEYLVEAFVGGHEAQAETLDGLGKDGWELVAVEMGVAYLRRERQA